MKNKRKKEAIKKYIYLLGGYEKVKKLCKLTCSSSVRQWVSRGHIPYKHQVTLYNLKK